MKPNPMSSKIAAAIIIATAGAALSIAPAHAAEEALPTQIVQTINKYDVSSFQAPVFESPKVVSWAVAYTPNLAKAELDPAEKAILSDGAQLAQKQKTIVENAAAVKRAELQRIAAAKAAAEKIEAERVAAVQAAEKAAADAAAAEVAAKAEAERVVAVQAAEKVAAEKIEAAKVVTATKAAAAAKAATQGKTAATPTQNVAVAGSTTGANGSNGSNDSNPTATTPASSDIGMALVASAYSQLGVRQDCTAMVEKALRSVGKTVGDIGPNGFYRYGTVVTDPQPGDLMIKSSHVAIYVGNGMAISGGFNNFNTELHPVSYIAGSTYVRVS